MARHRATAYRVARRIGCPAAVAEQVARDALVRAWRAVAGPGGDAAFTTALYRTATALALQRLSPGRGGTSVAVPLRPRRPADLDPVAGADARRRLAAALAALDALSPSARACWVLRELEGLAPEELAIVFDVDAATIKRRLHEARVRLARALARYEAANTS